MTERGRLLLSAYCMPGDNDELLPTNRRPSLNMPQAPEG